MEIKNMNDMHMVLKILDDESLTYTKAKPYIDILMSGNFMGIQELIDGAKYWSTGFYDIPKKETATEIIDHLCDYIFSGKFARSIYNVVQGIMMAFINCCWSKYEAIIEKTDINNAVKKALGYRIIDKEKILNEKLRERKKYIDEDFNIYDKI